MMSPLQPFKLLSIVAAVTLAGCGIPTPPVMSPIVPLRSAPADVTDARKFGAIFCGVLTHQPDPNTGGPCSTYFDPASTPASIPSDDAVAVGFRILVIPGIFGECVQDYALPWEDGKRHLHDAHHTDVEYLSVPALGSSVDNGKLIVAYLADHFSSTDQRPYIVFGYSKGAPDILEALTMDVPTRGRIAAVVTIAGAVIGSRLAEGVPRGIIDPLRGLTLGPCTIDDAGGAESLRRSVRAKALADLPQGVNAFSIAAVALRPQKVSKVLLNGFVQLQAFSVDQDSQVIREDAIVPGGRYLGSAIADHWAVALPFEHVRTFHPNTPPALAKLFDDIVDQNHYPRAALFEAALRFAAANSPKHAD